MWTTPCWTTTASRRISAIAWNRHSGLPSAHATGQSSADCASSSGFADYLASLQEFRAGLDDHPELLAMSEFLLEYPFAARLFPRALEAIAHLSAFGRPAMLSDGDIVFQPRKIQRSGIWDAVEGRVMIYLHKERVLDHMQQRYPARPLRHGRRQAEPVGRHEVDAREQTHHGIRAPGSLRARRGGQFRGTRAGHDDRAHRRSGSTTIYPTFRSDHDNHENPARSGPKPVARQHHARNARQRHAAPLHRRVVGHRPHVQSDDLR